MNIFCLLYPVKSTKTFLFSAWHFYFVTFLFLFCSVLFCLCYIFDGVFSIYWFSDFLILLISYADFINKYIFFSFHVAELWNRWAQRVSCLSRNIFRIFCMGTADYARHHRKYIIIRIPRSVASVHIFMILIDGVWWLAIFILVCLYRII